MRQRYTKKYLQILKRSVILSEMEYYLVKGIVDGGVIEPGATEGAQLQAMLVTLRFDSSRPRSASYQTDAATNRGVADDTRYAITADHLNTPRRATWLDGDLRWQ